jgi:Bacterial archaeo-eukaryotic release factor family 3
LLPGHAAAGDDAKLDQERFFRAVDRAIWERVSRDSGLPLVLVALPEQQAAFRAIFNNPQLLSTGVDHGPAGLSDRQLLEKAWACVEPAYLARLQKFAEDFNVALSRGQATDDLDAAGRAAHAGRVGILLIEADRAVPGRLDPDSGTVRPADDAEAGDLLGDLAALVLRRKGDVVIVPKERMPTTTGLAAIYRF